MPPGAPVCQSFPALRSRPDPYLSLDLRRALDYPVTYQIMSGPRLLLHALMFTGIAHAAEMRAWTDLQNRTIEARLIRLDGESVILELKDGRKVPLALAKLSAADADYARSQSSAATPATPGPNFAAPWPEHIKFGDDPGITIIEENADKKRFIYESSNYRYTCDVRLAKSVVKGFAVMFEATHLFCRTLPLGLDGGKKTDGKLQIFLYENFNDYVTAGGPEHTSGVFIGHQAAVLVPLTSLGVRPVGSGYMLDREKSSKTLPHELTHQLTPDSYFAPGGMGWFTEGLAEYVAVTPYRSGGFNVRNNHGDIVAYATGYGTKNTGGRSLGKDIKVDNLKAFMLQDYAKFVEDFQMSYGCGLLITYYFLQMDGAGDGKRIKAFLTALRDGKTGEDALASLLDGRSFDQLAADITKAWKRRGIELGFRTGG